MTDHDQQPGDGLTFSQVLERIGAREEPKLHLGELVNAFGERGFGALMLFLGLISAVIGAVPGTTTVLGAPIVLIAFQLVIRRDQLWLPKWALKGSLDRSAYRDAVAKVMKPLRSVERISRPRLLFMSTDAAEMLIGLICMLLAIVLMLPITGGNLIPSLIIAAFGFGMTQKDGLIVLIAMAATAAVATGIWLAWELIQPFLMNAWDWLTSRF